jgi:hypothetical protein
MAGIAQLELGNSQLPLFERLLVPNMTFPLPLQLNKPRNRLDLAAVPHGC